MPTTMKATARSAIAPAWYEGGFISTNVTRLNLESYPKTWAGAGSTRLAMATMSTSPMMASAMT